jgi:hypothetical protein
MKCVFGIFDILGFTSFCRNCEPQMAEAVLKILDELEIEIPRQLWLQFDPENKIPPEKKELVTNRLRWLIFSDTILVAMPLEDSAHPDTLKFNLLFLQHWPTTSTGECLKLDCQYEAASTLAKYSWEGEAWQEEE